MVVKKMKQRSAGKPDIEMGKKIRLRRSNSVSRSLISARSWV